MPLNSLNSRGFTLLELLVVIAIIGILSGVVVAFLVGAKNSGNDVAIKNNLREIRNLAENYYSDNGQYTNNSCGGNQATSCLGTSAGTLCMHSAMLNFISSVTATQDRIRDADIASGGTGNGTSRIYCRINANNWAVSAKLRSDQTHYWCLDSSGASFETTTNISVASPVACVKTP